jgi:hypothetical protein
VHVGPYLDDIIPPQILQLLLPDLFDSLLELSFPGHELDHPDRAEDLVHQSCPLVTSAHQTVLRVDDEFTCEMIDGEGYWAQRNQ